MSQKIDKDCQRNNLGKCRLAKTEIKLLFYKFQQTGVSPLNFKAAAIRSFSPLKKTNTTQIFSCVGSSFYLI